MCVHVCIYVCVYREERSCSLFRALECYCSYFAVGIIDEGRQQKAEDEGAPIAASVPISVGGVADMSKTMLLVTGNAFSLWNSIASVLVKEGIKVTEHLSVTLTQPGQGQAHRKQQELNLLIS